MQDSPPPTCDDTQALALDDTQALALDVRLQCQLYRHLIALSGFESLLPCMHCKPLALLMTRVT